MKTKILMTFLLITQVTTSLAKAPYIGSNFDDVWNQVTSDSYNNLPAYKVGYKRIINWGVNKIMPAAERTLSDRSDLLPKFEKLAHPNGICLAGTWNITQENPYSGYFKKDSHARIIVRASTALSNTRAGKLRSFGMAGKLFLNAEPGIKVPTANFFLVDDLGGKDTDHYTETQMTNEPASSVTSQVMKVLRYALTLAKTFKKADDNPGMRQLYEISELGENKNKDVLTPKWMMVRAATNMKEINEKDFRNELNLSNRGGELNFEIYVASKISQLTKAPNWKLIGNINLSESAISESCDSRLHFHHPKWKTSIKHK